MPILLPPDISLQIREINDQPFAGFIGFPSDTVDSADKWADIVDATAIGIVPASTTTSIARTAFQTVFSSINPILQIGLVVFPAAFTAYAAALIPGMLPAFVGVPPPVPIDISPVIPIGLSGASGSVCALALANIIYLWFITGTATPSGGGSPINWS